MGWWVCVCVWLCVFECGVCSYVYINFMSIHMCERVYMYMYIYIYMYIHARTYICIYIYMYMYTYAYMYIYVYLYVYTCTCVSNTCTYEFNHFIKSVQQHTEKCCNCVYVVATAYTEGVIAVPKQLSTYLWLNWGGGWVTWRVHV